MKHLAISIALSLLFIAPSLPADNDEEDLIRLLNEFMHGASINDEAAHDRFWAEDLIYTSSSGERFGKEEIMSGFTHADEDSEDEPASVYTAEDIRIQQYGDTAVMAFKLVGVTESSADQPAAKTEMQTYFNTGTLIRRDDEWRVVAWQATKIPLSAR
jgi:hypothetical protein